MDYNLLKKCIQASEYKSLAALARKMEIPKGNFNQMLNGKRNLTIARFEKICELIGLPPRMFFPH